MRNFKEIQELIDKYYKAYDKDGNRVDDNATEYEEELQQELEFMINWDGKLEDIMSEINGLRKELKTHTHSKGVVYVKL